MNILFSDLLLKLFVVILAPRFVAGFALVPPLQQQQQQSVVVTTVWTRQRPFDSFKARRKSTTTTKSRGDVVVTDAIRFGSSSQSSRSRSHSQSPMDSMSGSSMWNQFVVAHNSLLSFSSKITASIPGSPDDVQNRTFSEKNNDESVQEIHENSNNDTHSTNNQHNNHNNSTKNNGNKTSSVSSSSFTRLSFDSKNKTSRSTGIGSYFPFLDQSQSKAQKGPPTVKTRSTNKYKNQSNGNGKNKENDNDNSAKSLLNKQANETITVADLQVVLAEMQMQSANPYKPPPNRMKTYSSNEGSASNNDYEYGGSKFSKSSTSSKQVAFPQPSAVKPREIRRGTAVASCLLGMILGTTILPNLWLVGMMAGVFYGFEITKDLFEESESQADKTIVANFLISCGRQLARAYINIVDGGKALWFLYKTGQLSYEYYKTYENLDQKFAIQNKVDAWNKVFVKGKRKFDAWEQENEVGRKMLAGIRTAWLVDEESRMRAAGRSKYRLLQSAYDLRRSANKLLQKGLRSMRSIFREGELQTFWKGVRTSWHSNTDGSLATRIGAIVAAVVAVNVCGALFSLSVGFSNLLAIAAAVIWPSWAPDLVSRTQEIWLETKSRGSSSSHTSSSKNNNKIGFLTPYECIQKKYEEYSSDRMRQSRQNKDFWKRNSKRAQKRNNQKPKQKPKRRSQKSTSSSWFGLSDWRTRKGSGRRR
jgi:hypothetical protein